MFLFVSSHPPFKSTETCSMWFVFITACTGHTHHKDPINNETMRRSIIHHIATAVVIIFVMEVLPVASNEAHKRCQKSGCREGAPAAAEEPTLIVASARSGRKSPPAKFFPFLMLWVASFVVLRLAIHYIIRLITLIPVACAKLPEIRVGACVGHYYDYFISIILRSARMMFARSSRQKNRSGQGMRSRTSNRSLGSLADLLDDSSLDSSSTGYSSGYSITSSDGDSNDGSSALESGSGSGFSGFTFSDSSADSTSYTEDQFRKKDSIVSKFLTYISESNPDEFIPRRSLPLQRKNASGPVDDKLRRSHNNMGTVGIYNSSNDRDLDRKRRYSVDEMNYPSYRTQFASSGGRNRRASTESNNQRKGISNMPESSRTREKSSNEGVKMRKAAAAKTNMTSQNNDKSNNYGESKSPKRQQQQKQQRPMQQQDKGEKKKKSSLHHHSYKSSASNKQDNYSTTISTSDLR